MDITLYQTLEDRGNPEDVEDYGPFICRRKTAWLGDGYYFWDTHIQLAHWWGKTAYGVNNYIICKAKGVLDENCWDLHGNGNHRLEYEAICDEIVKIGLSKRNSLLVADVISYVKSKGFFKFKAIRAFGIASIKPNNPDFQPFRMYFAESGVSYLDLRPAVQICLLEKRALSLNSYMVVFPDDYNYSFA